MTAYDRLGQPLKRGDKVFFTGTVERVTEHDPEDGAPLVRVLLVRSDYQPKGYEILAEMHPLSVELLREES